LLASALTAAFANGTLPKVCANAADDEASLCARLVEAGARADLLLDVENEKVFYHQFVREWKGQMGNEP